MSVVTGGFDAVLQIAGPALEKAARAMHQAGNLLHSAVRIHNGTRFELSFGPPRLEFPNPVLQDPWARCVARTRMICRTQSVADPYGAVESAVVDLALQGRFELPAGDPVPINSDSALLIDWSGTTSLDITVHSVSTTLQTAIRGALMDMAVTNEPGVFAIGHLKNAGVTSVALIVVPGAAATPSALTLGLNVTGMAGVRSAIPNLLTNDWVVAIDADVVRAQVRTALGQALGGKLPPPYGSSPVLVNESTVCALQTPLGCVDARQRTYLDALTIGLTIDGIKFSGQVRQETESVFVPPVSASWDATVALGVTPEGTISGTIGVPTVHLNQWYAVVANVLTDNRLEGAVGAGVQAALDAGLGADDPAGLLGILVKQLATAGRTANAAISPRPIAIEARPDALLVHGAIDYGLPAAVPVAKLSAQATPTPGELLFTAGASWAPGDDVISYTWELGDGAVASSTGTNASFAANHTYLPGVYNACVEVSDSQGRSTRQCISVQPGRLFLEHIPDGTVSKSAWQACVDAGRLELIFEVTSCGTRLPGVTVTANGKAWSKNGVTDERGRVSLALDASRANPLQPGSHSPSGKGSFSVEASLAGFTSATGELELFACNELGRMILATKQEFADRIDRLVGYAALRDLIASGIGKQSLPPPGLPDQPTKLRLQPRITVDEIDAIGVGIGTRVLSDLIQLLEMNRDVFPVHELLGLDPNAKDFGRELDRRLDVVWSSLDAVARRLQSPVGPQRPVDDRPL